MVDVYLIFKEMAILLSEMVVPFYIMKGSETG
jgi:hypothetical protein